MDKSLAHIATLTGQENLFTDQASLAAYAAVANYGDISGSLPLAIARPRHPAQLTRLLSFCASEKIPLAVRGNGTWPQQLTALNGRILLVTTGLDRIFEINAKNRMLHAQAGVECHALRTALAAKNLFCPLGPFGTLGGAIAVNPATSQTLKYGTLSNFVSSLEIALANGERLYAPLPDNAPGSFYSEIPLAGLICGSKGQLGVIVACHLRLLPAPAASTLLAYEFDNLAAAVRAAGSILASPLIPSRLEIYDSVCAQALGLPSASPLVCGFEGSAADVEASKAECGQILAKAAVSEPESGTFAALLPLLLKAKGRFRLARAACPPDRLGDLLVALQDLATEYELEMAIHCDAAVASAQIAIFNAAQPANLGAFEKRLFTAELMLNEALGSEAEADLTRREWQAARDRGVAGKLKALFDPAGILTAAPDASQK